MTSDLRQKKYYKTKFSLVNFFSEKLKNEEMKVISIKDLCIATDISEATFFNYFPQKTDVMVFLLKAKLCKIYYTIKNLQDEMTFTQLIETMFELIADELKHINFFNEMISIFKANNIQIDSVKILPEELKYMYPDCPNIEKTSFFTLNAFFEELVAKAANENKIPKDICKKTLSQFLLILLRGIPLSISSAEFKEISQIFKKHLGFVWKIFNL